MKRIRSVSVSLMLVACTGMVVPPTTFAELVAKRQAPAALDVSLQEGGMLLGQVVDRQGAPRVSVQVSIRKKGRELGKATTDSQGRFAVRGLKNGVYDLALASGSIPVRAWDKTTAPPKVAIGALLVDGVAVRAQSTATAPVGGSAYGSAATPTFSPYGGASFNQFNHSFSSGGYQAGPYQGGAYQGNVSQGGTYQGSPYQSGVAEGGSYQSGSVQSSQGLSNATTQTGNTYVEGSTSAPSEAGGQVTYGTGTEAYGPAPDPYLEGGAQYSATEAGTYGAGGEYGGVYGPAEGGYGAGSYGAGAYGAGAGAASGGGVLGLGIFGGGAGGAGLMASPWLIGAGVAAAVAIPVALNDAS